MNGKIVIEAVFAVFPAAMCVWPVHTLPAAEIAPIMVRTVERPGCELSLMLDFGREVESCGVRLVSDPDRW